MARPRRTWILDDPLIGPDGDAIGLDRDAIRQGLAELEFIGERTGDAFVVAPIREKHIIGGVTRYVTTGWRVELHAAPVARTINFDEPMQDGQPDLREQYKEALSPEELAARTVPTFDLEPQPQEPSPEEIEAAERAMAEAARADEEPSGIDPFAAVRDEVTTEAEQG